MPEAKIPRSAQDWPEHYSPKNQEILTVAGCTAVAGYKEWQSVGRQVRKGEHGVSLYAPVTRKDRETGEVRMVNVTTRSVFDVAQTDAIPVEVAA